MSKSKARRKADYNAFAGEQALKYSRQYQYDDFLNKELSSVNVHDSNGGYNITLTFIGAPKGEAVIYLPIKDLNFANICAGKIRKYLRKPLPVIERVLCGEYMADKVFDIDFLLGAPQRFKIRPKYPLIFYFNIGTDRAQIKLWEYNLSPDPYPEEMDMCGISPYEQKGQEITGRFSITIKDYRNV